MLLSGMQNWRRMIERCLNRARRSSAARRRKRDRQVPQVAAVERLEDRTLLSITASFGNGVLTITGSSLDDAVEIRPSDTDPDPDTVRISLTVGEWVDLQGGLRTFEYRDIANAPDPNTDNDFLPDSVPASLVTRIEVNLKKGDDTFDADRDTVSFRNPREEWPSSVYSADFEVHAGSGDDDIDTSGQFNSRLDRQFTIGGDAEIHAGSGNDFVRAASGDDRVFAGSGNDFVRAASGDDRVFGGDNDDRLWGGSGEDFLKGEDGHDRLSGHIGTALNDDSAHDTLIGGKGDDTLRGGGGPDTLRGNAGEDFLDGGAEKDLLKGGANDDSMRGGDGNDTLEGAGGDDELDGEDGDDTLEGAGGDDELDGEDGNDTLEGAGGDDELVGGDGNDIVDGGDDDDELDGDSGDDRLLARTGDDELAGDEGDDFLDGGMGDDSYIFEFDPDDWPVTEQDTLVEDRDGGDRDALHLEYTDLLDEDEFALEPPGALIDLESEETVISISAPAFGSYSAVLESPEKRESFEDVFSSGGDDTILGTNSENILFGGGGDDRIKGRGGDDTLNGNTGDDALFGGEGVDVLLGEGFGLKGSMLENFLPGLQDLQEKRIQLAGIASAPVGNGQDTLRGEAGFDVLMGGPGTDELVSGAGGGLLAGDSFRAEASLNLDFRPVFGATSFDAIKDTLGKVLDFTTAVTLEGAGNDTIRGGSGLELVLGGDGNDTVEAGGLVDVIFGNGGNDTVDASPSEFSIVFGGDGDDTVTGGTAGNFLVGGNDSDTLSGGAGVDVILGDSFDFTKTEQVNVALTKFENSTFSFGFDVSPIDRDKAGNDTLKGDAGFDFLAGGDGNDTIESGAGLGIVFGDAFSVSAGLDVPMSEFDDSSTGSTSTTRKTKSKGVFNKALRLLGSPEFSLVGAGRDMITGGAAFDLIFGGEKRDVIHSGSGIFDVLFGNDGNDDLLADTTEFSLMVGGRGDDLLDASTTVDGSGSILLGDTFDFLNIPTSVASLFNVEFSGILPVKFAIEAGMVQDGKGTDTLFGAGGGFNLMIGGDGKDELTGGGFFDFVMGDSFNAGTDLSIDFSGLSLNKSLDENLDAIETSFELPGLAGTGPDTIQGGDGLMVALGGDGNDTVKGSTGEFNLLMGGNGDDTIFGKDSFNVAFGDSFTPLSPLNFVDTFSAAAKAVIFDDPKLFLEAVESWFGFTDEGNDVYTGGPGIDIAFGGAKDDRLSGGPGSFDFLVGGSGDDVVDGQMEDDVTFGGPGDDELFGGEGNDHLESEGGKDVFHAGTGNDRIAGGANDDQLFGEAGNDELFGEEGDDLLDGGPGDDFLDGGPGIDTLINGAASRLAVDEIVVNQGAIQRSNVSALTIQFSGNGNLEPLIDSGEILDVVEIHGITRNLQEIPLHTEQFRWDDDKTVLTIDLTKDGFGDSRRTMLEDGDYQLQLADDVFQDTDGLADGLFRHGFHRLAGDFNGDRVVDRRDQAAWFDPSLVRFGTRAGQSGYNVAFDLDEDGLISARDYYFWLRGLVGNELP